MCATDAAVRGSRDLRTRDSRDIRDNMKEASSEIWKVKHTVTWLCGASQWHYGKLLLMYCQDVVTKETSLRDLLH